MIEETTARAGEGEDAFHGPLEPKLGMPQEAELRKISGQVRPPRALQGLADWLRLQAKHPCASAADRVALTAWAREVDAADAERRCPALHLTRSSGGTTTVAIDVDGRWVNVITEHGDIISHIVESLGIRKRVEQALGTSTRGSREAEVTTPRGRS